MLQFRPGRQLIKNRGQKSKDKYRRGIEGEREREAVSVKVFLCIKVFIPFKTNKNNFYSYKLVVIGYILYYKVK